MPHLSPSEPCASPKFHPLLDARRPSLSIADPSTNGGRPVSRMRSSPWIRGAPQVGFSAIIWTMRSRTSFDVCLLPTGFRTFEITLQYRRNPVRYHQTTVSGVTTMRTCFHPDQNQNPEDLIEYCESWPRTPSFQSHELLTKSQILHKQRALSRGTHAKLCRAETQTYSP
jgi:hypothetical protein